MLYPSSLIFPTRTITGSGTIAQLVPECAAFGPRGFLVHGRSLRAGGTLSSILASAPAGVAIRAWEHPGGEPTLAQVDVALCVAREHRSDWVVGVGGGSVLDIAKACATLYRAVQPLSAYHDGAPVEVRGLPFVAAPTTAGTGSEATVNAVLTNTDTGQKKSIRDDGMMARLIVLDPDLLVGCPQSVVAHSGMDALAQAIEAFTSRKAYWLSDTLALRGLVEINTHLEPVYRGAGGEHREGLLVGSFLSGLALSMARLGIIHGLAHPLGARYHVPHGLVCAVCLPLALEFNRSAIPDKYARMSAELGRDVLGRVCELLPILGVASPFAGQTVTDRDGIVRETLASGSTAANPRPVSAADVEWFLARLFCQ